MGVQFEHVAYSSPTSLTLIVDDITRHRDAVSKALRTDHADMEDWLNALRRQSAPLISSKAGKADLAAWLEAAENATAG